MDSRLNCSCSCELNSPESWSVWWPLRLNSWGDAFSVLRLVSRPFSSSENHKTAKPRRTTYEKRGTTETIINLNDMARIRETLWDHHGQPNNTAPSAELISLNPPQLSDHPQSSLPVSSSDQVIPPSLTALLDIIWWTEATPSAMISTVVKGFDSHAATNGDICFSVHVGSAGLD